jgi:hypothetical protein
MIEQNVRKIMLDLEEGLKFAQFGTNIAATGNDLSYPNKLQEPTETHASWLEKVPEGYHISPVHGVKKNQQ